MNKGFVSIITLLIIVGVISVGAAGTILILKSGSDKIVAEEEIDTGVEIEVNETPKAIPTSPVPQKPATKPQAETLAPVSLKPLVQTETLPPEVLPPPALVQEVIPPLQEEAVSCANDTRPQLTADITDFSKIRKITAPGTASIEGPKGHSFIWTGGARVPVYAPSAITLESGSYSKDTAESPAQYLLFFVVDENCNYRVKFDHIDEPIASIREQFSSTPLVGDSSTKEASVKLTFNAGDLIGYTSGTLSAGNWDFGLYNTKEEGILATQYNSYGIHGYAVCWTDFYLPDIKKQHYRNLLEGPTLVCFF